MPDLTLPNPIPLVTVSVSGTPVQQGTLNVGRQGQQYWSNGAELRPWRKKIAEETAKALPDDWVPTLGPVGLNIVFIHKRPKSRPKDIYKVTAPDADKLLRSVFDALTGVLYKDDCQVCDVHVADVYSGVFADAPEEGIVFRAYRFE